MSAHEIMNYFLMLIIIGLGWGGYYEYNVLQSQRAQDLQELKTDLANEQAENKKLSDVIALLKMNSNTAGGQGSAVAVATQSGQGQAPAAANPGESAPAASPVSPSANSLIMPPVENSNLGTFSALDGHTYANSKVLKIDSEGIVISYDGGITKVLFLAMPPDLQKRFNFIPNQATP